MHMHEECLEAKHFLSRQLMFTGHHLYQGLSESPWRHCFPWTSTEPSYSSAGGHWGGQGEVRSRAEALRLGELQQDAAHSGGAEQSGEEAG